MKRVMIVDDDFIVRTYLKQMIPWKEKGFLLIGDAKNGKEALDICQHQRPDIVITDMSMPVMSGMELISALKQQPATKNIGIIVLSCHDDFVYVKDAMKSGADDYLLKNDLSAESLLEALNKIKVPDRLVDNTEDTPERLNSNMTTEELATIGQRKLLNDFFVSFNSRQVKDINTLHKLADLANIKAKFAMSSCILINISDWQERVLLLEHETILSFNQAFFEMCSTVCKNNIKMTSKISTYIFHSQKNEAYWSILIDFANENSQTNIHRYLQTITTKINAFSLRYFNLKTYCYVSTVQHDLLELKRHWLNLYELIGYNFYQDDNIIFEEDRNLLSNQVPVIMVQMIDDLAEAVNRSSNDIFAEKLKGFFAILFDEKMSISCLKQIVYDLEVRLQQRCNIDWEKLHKFDDFKRQFSAYINKLRVKKEVEHPAIRMALSWIDAHYKEAISQQSVADYVHLNPAYFSTLFKNNMNITFSDYLINYRLEKVKKRLTRTNDKIKDIAFDEGFADYQYFCKLFKRVVGVNPSEYRHGI